MPHRFLVLDFETNGFNASGAKFKDWTLPCQNFPTQLSVDVIEDGEITHAFDTVIKGAKGLSAWSKANVNITLEDLEHGQALPDVLETFAELITDDTTLVAHNISFDLDQALARTASKIGLSSPALEKILKAPRFCTMNCAYSKLVVGKRANLGALCAHFQIDLSQHAAHDAVYDTRLLAQCLCEALRRGVML